MTLSFLSLYRITWEPLLAVARLFAAPERLAADLPDFPDLPEMQPRPSPWKDGWGGGAIWLHAASLGECKGLWAFAQTLWTADPGVRIVFTTNTAAGLDFLRNKLAAAPRHRDRGVARLAPLDHPRVVTRLLRAFDIRALVLFEVELWPHWLLAARRALGPGVPVLWISARVTERARRRYAGNGFFAAALRRVLGGIAWTQAQTAEEAALLRGLGAPLVETGGDLRGLHYLDAAETSHIARLPIVGETPRHGIAFVSMHAQELPAIVPILREARKDEPIWIFPRKLKELPAFRKSLEPYGFVMPTDQPSGQPLKPSKTSRVIVGSFGHVAETLKTSRVAVVGGSFLPHGRIGGHNLWEPLLAGAIIVIGPQHGNQLYLARRLADAGLLHVARNDGELSEALIANADRLKTLEARNKMAALRENFIANERALLQQAAARAVEMILAVPKKHD